MSVGSIPTILFFDPGIGIAEFSKKRGRVIQLYDLSSPNSVFGATIEMLTHHARNRLIDKRRSHPYAANCITTMCHQTVY